MPLEHNLGVVLLRNHPRNCKADDHRSKEPYPSHSIASLSMSIKSLSSIHTSYKYIQIKIITKHINSRFLHSLPERNWLDVVGVLLETLGVLFAHFHQLLQVFLVDLDSHIAQILEVVVLDLQSILRLLISGILDIFIFRLRIQLHQDIFQLVKFMGRSHLIQNMNFVQFIFLPILDGHSQAFHGVVNVDESSCLSTSPIQSHWVPIGDLGTKTVEDSPIIRIDINSVNKVWMHVSFWSIDSPDNTLVELGNLQAEKFLEVQKSYIIKTFRHMINTSRVVRMDYFDRFAVTLVGVGTVELRHTIPFRDVKSFQSSISINSHCSDMDDMTFLIIFHHSHEDIFGGNGVIFVSIVDSFQRFHGIRGCSLFRQMNDNIWFKFCKQLEELGFLVGNVDLCKLYFFP